MDAVDPWQAIILAIVLITGLIVKFHKQIVDGLIDAWDEVKKGISDAWNWIVSAFKKYWIYILAAFTGPIGLIIGLVIKFHNDIEHWFEDAINFVEKIWSDGWNAVKDFGEMIWGDIRVAFNDELNGWKTIWDDFWGDIKSVATTAWGWLKTGFDTFWSWMKTGWNDAVGAFKTIWQGIQNAAEAPVKFVVNTVYNDGIVPVVDAIAGIIGKHPLNKVSFATGGVVPGFSKTDNVHGVSVRGGEGILVPEAVAMLGGPGAIHALNSRAGYGPSLGFQTGYAAGGVVPNATGGVGATGTGNNALGQGTTTHGTGGSNPFSDIVHGVEDVAGDIAKTLRNLAGDALAAAINGIVNPLIDKIPGTGNSIGETIKQDIVHIENDFVNWVKGETASSGSAGGVSTAGISGSLLTMLKQYSAKVGWNGAQVTDWEGVIDLESGGSYTAKNPTSDAYGLAQFIGGPSGYAQYGGNLTPSGQVTAMGNYIKERYGDPAAALAHEHAFHWYADGTASAQAGWAWVGERGPELAYLNGGEKIYSHEQSMAALSSMPAISGYFAGTSPSIPADSFNQEGFETMKQALRATEMKLDSLISATKNVGPSTASALNSTGRTAGNRSAFNTTGY
jgi:hypothetical protein